MIAVIFEVEPVGGRREVYLNIAANLREELEQMDGFLGVERFESLTNTRKMLSLSFWRDEEAVRNWRCYGKHRSAQAAGRGGIFATYRLRVANVVRDYGLNARDESPDDSREAHDDVIEF